jgi:hypothetical protein
MGTETHDIQTNELTKSFGYSNKIRLKNKLGLSCAKLRLRQFNDRLGYARLGSSLLFQYFFGVVRWVENWGIQLISAMIELACWG